MACSSSYRKGKGVIDENEPQQEDLLMSLEGGVVLAPSSISSYRAENTTQVEYSQHSRRVLKGSKKLFDSHVSFGLSEEEADYIRRMDEVIGGLWNAAGEKTGSWVPLPVRLEGWTIETRQRLDKSEKIEQFFHHPHVSRVLRSKKHVVHYICYGSVPPPEKGKIKKSPKAENECWGKSIKKRNYGKKIHPTEKEFVEAFLAESYSNLMKPITPPNKK